MPPSRADRQLLLVTGSFLLVAAVLVAMVLYLATTRQDDDTAGRRPFFIGLERSLKKSIRDESPLYFANPGAGDGFWLDIENGELVALVLDRPGTEDCVVKWKERAHGYVDCDGNVLQSEQLDRYKVTVGPRGEDQPKTAVYVDLRKTSPAPEPQT